MGLDLWSPRPTACCHVLISTARAYQFAQQPYSGSTSAVDLLQINPHKNQEMGSERFYCRNFAQGCQGTSHYILLTQHSIFLLVLCSSVALQFLRYCNHIVDFCNSLQCVQGKIALPFLRVAVYLLVGWHHGGNKIHKRGRRGFTFLAPANLIGAPLSVPLSLSWDGMQCLIA